MNHPEDTERFRQENMHLSQQQMQMQGPPRKKGMSCGLMMLIGGVFGICFLVFGGMLAIVALPMYSTFKQKTMAAQAIQSVDANLRAFSLYYIQNNSFEGLSVDPAGGPVRGSDAILAEYPYINWSVSGYPDQLDIHFSYDANCPPCGTTVVVICDSVGDCQIQVFPDDESDPLGISYLYN